MSRPKKARVKPEMIKLLKAEFKRTAELVGVGQAATIRNAVFSQIGISPDAIFDARETDIHAILTQVRRLNNEALTSQIVAGTLKEVCKDSNGEWQLVEDDDPDNQLSDDEFEALDDDDDEPVGCECHVYKEVPFENIRTDRLYDASKRTVVTDPKNMTCLYVDGIRYGNLPTIFVAWVAEVERFKTKYETLEAFLKQMSHIEEGRIRTLVWYWHGFIIGSTNYRQTGNYQAVMRQTHLILKGLIAEEKGV